MTVDACLGRRNRRMGRFIDRIVAISTVHLQLTSMNHMAKRDWLSRFVANVQRDWASYEQEHWRCVKRSATDDEGSQKEQEFVRPAWKQKALHNRNRNPKFIAEGIRKTYLKPEFDADFNTLRGKFERELTAI